MAQELVEFEGLKELQARLRNLGAEVLDDPGLLAAMKKDAHLLRDRARSNVKSITGILRKNIVGHVFKEQKSLEPMAFVAINRNPKKGAPHAHNVEYGHAASGWYKGGANVPAHPFFRPAFRAFRRLAFAESYLRAAIRRLTPKPYGRTAGMRGGLKSSRGGFGRKSVR